MIEIIREEKDGLKRKVWQFHTRMEHAGSDKVLVTLDAYQDQVRQTKRHGWKSVANYRNFDKRQATIKEVSGVPMPHDVKLEAISRVEIFIQGDQNG